MGMGRKKEEVVACCCLITENASEINWGKRERERNENLVDWLKKRVDGRMGSFVVCRSSKKGQKE